MSGGAIWPVDKLHEVAATAQDAGIATHMDGARLMNASVKTGVPAATYAQGYDSVWIDFTKGLGAPVGAALAGSHEFISQAWRTKQRLGGAMRQSGIVASMCLYALDHNIDRLAEDHLLAAHIGNSIADMELVDAVLPVDTNIVIFDLADIALPASDLVKALQSDGIQIGAFGQRRIRIVTHLDVTAQAADHLLQRIAYHLQA